MFSTLRRDAAFCCIGGCGACKVATPAFSQGPSEAQREAVKSQCRSDYIAHCSSIPPGGEASSAMPCEEHVEPFGRMRRRGARDRGRRSAQDRNGAGCCRACQAIHTGCCTHCCGKAPPLKPPSLRPPRPPANSRPARRSTRSRAPAAPTIQKSARACRPAARRHWNVWKRTRRKSRRGCGRPLPPQPAARRPQPARLGRSGGSRGRCSSRLRPR